MEDRLIPINNHLQTNLNYWTRPYRQVLRNQDTRIRDPKFVISLLHWTMEHFILHAGLIEHGRFVVGGARETYPSYHELVKYIHLMMNLGLVIANSHGRLPINPYEFGNGSVLSPHDVNGLQQLFTAYHGHEDVLLRGFWDVQNLTERLVEHNH